MLNPRAKLGASRINHRCGKCCKSFNVGQIVRNLEKLLHVNRCLFPFVIVSDRNPQALRPVLSPVCFFRDSILEVMASPSPADFSSSVLKEILRRARAEGSLDAVVSELLSDQGDEFELIPGGEVPQSMSDASKRRMVDPPEKEVVMSGVEKGLSLAPAAFGTKLPKGIRDMEHWGKTVLASGKFEKSGFTYAELLASPRQDHASYCTWMLSQKQRLDLTPPIKDFVRYLYAKNLISQSEEEYFEGSTVRRVTKP